MSQQQLLPHPQDDRAFLNNLQVDSTEPVLDPTTEQPHVRILAPLESKYKEFAGNLLNKISEAYSGGLADPRDSSVYIGTSGVALLLIKLYSLDNDGSHLESALRLVEPSLSSLRGQAKDCSFLCGDAGPLAVSAVIANKLIQLGSTTHYKLREECIKNILSMGDNVCPAQRLAGKLHSSSSSVPDEMLYGKAGYLYALIYLQQELGANPQIQKVINKVVAAMVKSGKNLSSKMKSKCPLMYSFYNELYTGAAHGHAGIIYFLLKVVKHLVSSGKHKDYTIDGCPLIYSWHDEHYFGAAHGYAGILYLLLKVAEPKYDSILRETVDCLLNLQFPSGNFPSSFERQERDRLVHWCHGAPGFIYMLCAAYERFKDEKYKKSALDCVEVVWQRGLLRKGYGLCHGVAGNGYTFLCAYKLTGEVEYLHKACKFADWCTDYGKHGCRTPDRPFSLFEGMAGTAYFLLDLIYPSQANFPAFQFDD